MDGAIRLLALRVDREAVAAVVGLDRATVEDRKVEVALGHLLHAAGPVVRIRPTRILGRKVDVLDA